MHIIVWYSIAAVIKTTLTWVQGALIINVLQCT